MYPLLAASILLLALTGCGAAKSENITAGMEAIKSLDYDTALTCFEAAKEAGENERLLSRGEGIAYVGKTGTRKQWKHFLPRSIIAMV